MSNAARRRGLSLIELIAVVAITATLLALLVPAVQAVREAASLTQCANNLRQIGLAVQSNHDGYRRFPSGGWGWNWVGIPGRATGPEQPGGWLYNVLAFLEQGTLRQLGAGQVSPLLEQSIVELMATPVPTFTCPTRRNGGPYDGLPQFSTYRVGSEVTGATLAVSAARFARSDYAANAGSQAFNEIFGGPATLAEGDDAAFAWPSTTSCNGIFFQRSAVSLHDVTRGASNTFLVGERYVNPDHYLDGADVGDNETMYVGFDNDVYRVTADPPQRDQSGYSNTLIFGSAHAAGVNMLYCDGTVRLISFEVELEIFLEAGRRWN
jgi:prepilin-type N-terminal cleavage/methylation domain-containing protein